MVILAVDPGIKKCGLALVSGNRGILRRSVVARERVGEVCRQWSDLFPIERVLVGGSTGSQAVVSLLERELQRPISVVDETHSTERARLRYVKDHPPQGWRRGWPLGLQVPPEPYDDYAAVVLAEDYLSSQALEA